MKVISTPAQLSFVVLFYDLNQNFSADVCPKYFGIFVNSDSGHINPIVSDSPDFPPPRAVGALSHHRLPGALPAYLQHPDTMWVT